MKNRKTVLIVGCGIVGASHAFEFASHTDFEVIVVESASGPAMNFGTGSSSACIRRCYSSTPLTRMADYGVHFLKSLQEENLGRSLFNQAGCLTIGKSKDGFLADQSKIFDQLHYRYSEMTNDEMRKRYPSLSIESDEIGVLDEESGYADPQQVTALLVEKSTQLGAKFYFNAFVKSLTTNNSKVTGVVLENGDKMTADIVILASALGTRNLLNSIDVREPTKTSLRPVFTMRMIGKETNHLPVMADLTNSIYVRKEGSGILIGSLSEEDESFEVDEPVESYDFPPERLALLAERAAKRFPDINLNTLHIKTVFGIYDVNDLNWLPVQKSLGPEGLYVSYATSGHGFKLAFGLSHLLRNRICRSPVAKELEGVELALSRSDVSNEAPKGVLS